MAASKKVSVFNSDGTNQRATVVVGSAFVGSDGELYMLQGDETTGAIKTSAAFTPSGTQNVNLTQVAGTAVLTDYGLSTGNAPRVVAAMQIGGQAITNINPMFVAPSTTAVFPISATALPLPGGAATASNQATEIASLASIDTKTPALGQALAAASQPVVLTAAQVTTLTPQTNSLTDTQLRASAVPVSLASAPLATGAASSANQTTEISYLANISTDADVLVARVAGTSWTPVQYTLGSVTNQAQFKIGLTLGWDGTTHREISVTTTGLVKTDGSAVTQPISGAITANVGTTNGLALDTSVNSLLKPASTLAAVTAVGSITSTVVVKADTAVNQTNALKVDGSATTQPVSAATLPLPTGAATSAIQTTQQTSLNSIDGKLTTVNIRALTTADFVSAAQSGVWNITNISGTISLPAGAATSALQSTGNISIASIDTKTVVWALGAGSVATSARTFAIPGNVTGIADFGVGASSAQTQRVVLANESSTKVGRAKADLARNDYTVTSVTTSAYVQLLASTASAANRIQIFDSSGSALFFAIGAAASEVNQFYIPPGGIDIDFAIPAGTRIAIKAVDNTASSGQIIINFLS